MSAEPALASETASLLPPGWPVISLGDAQSRLTGPGAPFEIGEAIVHGVKVRTWKNAHPTIRELVAHARANFGERPYVVLEDERATFEATIRAALGVAAFLQERGVRKGDRVAIAMRNLPEYPAVLLGTVLIGAISVALNAWWTGPELEYGLTDSGSKVLFVDGERLERIAAHVDNCPALETICVTRDAPGLGGERVVHFESVVGRIKDWHTLPDRPLPDVALDPEDPATILYTSGTTGHPKGAVGSHRNAMTCTAGQAFSATRNFLRRGEAVPAPDPNAPQRVTLLGIPFFHTTGTHAVLLPSLNVGARIVLMRRWDTEQAMQLIERERVTSAGGVPTLAWQLVEHPSRTNYDLSSLESMAYGGAPAASDLVRRIKAVFPQAAPSVGWGMTETTSTFTSQSAEEYINRPESSGPAWPVCDMKVIDDDWNTLPHGVVGELVVAGPNVIAEYWNKPEATAATIRDGWLKTGDLARMDEEGFVYIVDRKKDMLIRGGENIYCVEVEDALCKHPAVVDAAVVGIPHRTLGEEPGAVVTLGPDAHVSEQELKAFASQHIAAFKVPVRIVFSPTMLPRNANGKILKRDLKAMFV
ncbi:long-chain-fatty-acid--CoA ligase [Variibacter gotjawalensis]|uniref:3-methylmercaptopropionyl-CoA ligase n=1 Tax=Variibacter gotjawalensis TaxID=1333996 RepID=A0A0S3PNL2_9BRAD|nr:AMP-binding protein [Variibacter gotjawalensis]NIK47811.1 long-chain acyl-CoA synthetase [Variibacter gotjawalensis]RZS49698.1 long-chain acyl-CoA synthetase [Variibacter gotjawalensis]BAT57527.1 long-chain-fatty-acid--CoA ligase [Variibacter gotjawalensis]